MRLIFFLLLLANIVFYAWSQGYLGDIDAGREPQRLAAQLAPDKLRVVAAGDAAAKPVCRLVSGLLPEAAESLKAALAGSGINVDIKPAEDAPRWWVHIPPQSNQAAADRKAAELRKLGVSDFAIELDEGPNRFALTLGLLRSEAAAAEFLQGLTKRGVKSARIEPRARPPQAPTVTVTGPAEAVNTRFAELLAKQPEAKAAACP